MLDRGSATIQVRNLQNEVTKKTAPPCTSVDAIFYAGTGMLLCRSDDKVRGWPSNVLILQDIQPYNSIGSEKRQSLVFQI